MSSQSRSPFDGEIMQEQLHWVIDLGMFVVIKKWIRSQLIWCIISSRLMFVWSLSDRFRLCLWVKETVRSSLLETPHERRELDRARGFINMGRACQRSRLFEKHRELFWSLMVDGILWLNLFMFMIFLLMWVRLLIPRQLEFMLIFLCLCKGVGYNLNESLSQCKWLATRRESNVYFGSAIGEIYIARPRDALRDGSWSGIQLADQSWPMDVVYWFSFSIWRVVYVDESLGRLRLCGKTRSDRV